MRGDGPGCSFESRTRSRSPISARMAALSAELRLGAFRMNRPHINTIMSPIPTRVYKPVRATPRHYDALILGMDDLLAAHWNFPTRICHRPIASRGNRGIVPGKSTKVNLTQAFGRLGLIVATAAT